MADLPVQPVQNYGQLLSSYGEGQAQIQDSNTNRLTALSQLPQTKANVAKTSAETTGIDQSNQIQALKLQAMANYAKVQQAAQAQTQPAPADADASGVNGDQTDAAVSAHLDAGLANKFKVNKGYTPTETQLFQSALPLAAMGDDSFVKAAQTQHEQRVANDTANSQREAQKVADSSYTVATAPEGTAVAALGRIHPETVAQLAKQVGVAPDHPENWTPEQKDEMDSAARQRATLLHEKTFQYTGDELKDVDGQVRNNRTGLEPVGHLAQGLSVNAYADLATKGKELVDVPQSDGSTKQMQRWQAQHTPSLSAWIKSSANGASAAGAAPGGAPGANIAPAAPGGGPTPPPPKPTAPGAQTTKAPPAAAAPVADPVLRDALADASYKVKTPPVISGQTPDPVQQEQRKAIQDSNNKLLADSGTAIGAASKALQYQKAAQAIIDSGGLNSGPKAGQLAGASALLRQLGFTDGITATNYQEAAKYLGNAAVQAGKDAFPNPTQSEVGLAFDQLNPSTANTPEALKALLDKNIKSTQYALDNAHRVKPFLASGGNGQLFPDWADKYYNREAAVNGPGGNGPKAITTKAAYDALPKGAKYTWNGRLGTKQ